MADCTRWSTIAATSSDAGEDRASDEAEMIDLTKTAISLLNARDFQNPWFAQHVSAEVRLDVQGQVNFGVEAFVGNFKNDASGSLNFQVDMGNVTAMLDEKKATGTVILSQNLKGFGADDRQMSGTILMNWALTGQKWICQSCIMMLGTPEFLL